MHANSKKTNSISRMQIPIKTNIRYAEIRIAGESQI